MFKLQPNPTFVAPVPLTRLGQEPGVITFTYRHLGNTEVAAWLDRLSGGGGTAVLAEVIDAWSGVADANGEPAAFSIDSLTQLFNDFPAAPGEIMDAYLRLRRESQLKN
jgi:hypothetical protein